MTIYYKNSFCNIESTNIKESQPEGGSRACIYRIGVLFIYFDFESQTLLATLLSFLSYF